MTSRVQRPRVARVACRRTCLASGLSRATEQPPVVVLLRHEAVLHEAHPIVLIGVATDAYTDGVRARARGADAGEADLSELDKGGVEVDLYR